MRVSYSDEKPIRRNDSVSLANGILIVEMKALFQRLAMDTATHLTTNLRSSQEWRGVLEEILPRQGEWSEEEYLVLTDHRNRLVEFTDGFLEVLPVPTDKHQAILGFLYLVFLNFIEPRGGKVRFSPLRLRIRPGKFREPDLLLLLSAADSRRQNRFWDGADLALEVVSEDKPERDLIEKRADYAEARVPEYWMVNPQTETVTVLYLRENTYEEAGTYRHGQLAASLLLADFSVPVTAVFDAD
jgi:Uma2 family endonuclease